MGYEMLAISGIIMGVLGIAYSTLIYIFAGEKRNKIKRRIIIADALGSLAILFGILAFVA